MPEPIVRLTLPQFQLLLPDRHALTREIRAVHLHHTWKPERADFRGLRTIEGMRNFHLEQGWEDIAQHLTVDPAGGLWTGRNWNRPPASSRGHNGTTAAGPFMIEMVGNFDTGHDPFDGEQRESALEVVGHLLRVFGLSVADIRLHRELNQGSKTCPGSGIDRDDIERDVQKRLRRKAPAVTRLFAREHLLGYEITRTAPAPVRGLHGVEVDATVLENDAAAAAVDVRTRRAVAAAQRARYSRDLSQLIGAARTQGEDWSMLEPHVVNLSRGELSEGGAVATSPADLDNIVDAIRDRASAEPDLKVLLYAHGGLVGETDALGYARQMHRWWLERGVYPIFFIWESGLLEILRQYVVGPRDVFDFTTDVAIEAAARPLGTLAWSGMKDSARRASAADLGEGYPGGAYLFAGKLASLAGEFPGLTFHAVGHSAGAIFQAHLLPALLAQGVPRIASLSLLAPACRTELFKEALLPLVNDGRLQRHYLFTMEDDAERQDDTFTLYRKSLLYLVSRAFEGAPRRPILGLDRSIRKDAVLSALYGIGQPGAASVEVHFSLARDKGENPLTRSVTHGGFDNDAKTMSAVLRRILGVPDDSGLGESGFPFAPLERSFQLPALPARAVPFRSTDGVAGLAPAIQTRAEGRRSALCIGIDRYRERPLAGCVNDARAWGRSLAALGFDVRYLLDEQATQAGMLDGLRTLLGGARAGDVLVLQYSGHGTQLPDDNADEGDGFDEAFVPVDYHTGALFLRDDLVGSTLTSLTPGVLLTLFMDCCHCGTISRFAPVARGEETGRDRVRYLPVSPELLQASRGFRRRSFGGRSRAADEGSAPGVVHLAACRDNEFAWESDGQGDFTAAALTVLAEAVTRGETNEAFLAGVARTVARKGRQQPMMMPAAAGMSGLRLLGGSGSGAVERPASGGPSSSDAASSDAELLRHLEAAVTLLRQRA
jgi:hypothetical protein